MARSTDKYLIKAAVCPVTDATMIIAAPVSREAWTLQRQRRRISVKKKHE
jgi:hypothetical protein